MVGPLVAGTVAENLSWRWVFVGLLPLVVAPVLLLLPGMSNSPVDPAGPQRPSRTVAAFVIAVGAAMVQLGGQQFEHGRDALGVAVGVVGLLGVALAARRLMPPGTARLRRGLPSVVALRGLQAGAFFGVEAFLPLMLVTHRGLSPTAAGAVLTGAALGWSAGSWWQGRRQLRVDRDRLPFIGALAVLLGLAVVRCGRHRGAGGGCGARVGAGRQWHGRDLLHAERAAVPALAPVAEQGVNSAALQMSDSLGSVLTVGIGGVVYAALRHEGGWAFGVGLRGHGRGAARSVLVSTRVTPRR